MRGPICTKFGGDIARSPLHTKFKNGDDILLGVQTTAGQIRALLNDKAKNSTFDPSPVKIRGAVDEISGSLIVAAPMTEPLVYICWPASTRVLITVVG